MRLSKNAIALAATLVVGASVVPAIRATQLESTKVALDASVALSTLFGGGDYDDIQDIKIGHDGSIYVAGSTTSDDLPTTASAPQPTRAGDYDLYVARLAPDGRRLIFATYVGGSGFEGRPTITVDDDGAVTLVGASFSADYPTRGAAQPSLHGGADGVVTRFAPDGSVLFSTYLGGDSYDYILGAAERLDGSLVLVGQTGSSDFPGAGASLSGETDAFICELRADGSQFENARLVGGDGDDAFRSVTIGPNQHAYAGGDTTSSNLPGGANGSARKALFASFGPSLTNVAPTTVPVDINFNGRQFVTAIAFDHDLLVFGGYVSQTAADVPPGVLPSSKGFVFTTDLDGRLHAVRRLGGSGADAVNRIAVDYDGRVTVVGETTSSDGFVTLGPPFQSAYGGGDADAFCDVLDSNLDLVEGGYLGGNGLDGAYACATDTLGNVYVGGVTYSSAFDVTPGAFQASRSGVGDAFLVKVTPRDPADAYSLEWLAPDSSQAAPAPPRGLTAAKAADALKTAETDGGARPVGYNVYRSRSRDVLESSASYYFSVRASHADTGPIVAGGAYYAVTAVYADGTESAPANFASGGVGEGTIRIVRLKPAKVVAIGTGFSATVRVFVDGIGFTAPATLKNGTKVIQRGTLENGQSVSAYLDAHGGEAALVVQNDNGALATFRLTR